MGVKFTAEQNNQVYREHKNFGEKWTYSTWLPLWGELAELIVKVKDKQPKIPIVELGCGTGQFAEMLDALHIINNTNYKGFDYSDVAVSIAKTKLNNYNFQTKDVEIANKNIYSKGLNLIVVSEVLEHLDDIAALSRVKNGSIVLASVPNFDAVDHIRHFNSETEVIERYSTLLDIQFCYSFHNYYIFQGIKKGYDEKAIYSILPLRKYLKAAKNKHSEKVFAVLPVKGRRELLKYSISRLYNKCGVDYVVCVGDNQEDMQVCEKAGAEWVYHPNEPLGEKWNAGIRCAMGRHPFDAFLFVGSSDWVSDNWVSYMLPYLKEFGMVGGLGCNLLDIHGLNSEFRMFRWAGYPEDNERYLEPSGGGRLYSGKLLEKINCNLFPNRNDSMDWFSMNKIQEAGGKIKTVKTSDIQLMAISTDKWFNMHRPMFTYRDQGGAEYSDLYSPKQIDAYLKKWFPETYLIFK